MSSNLNFTLKKGRVYEEWYCACSSCHNHSKVYFRQRNRWPEIAPIDTELRMELHGNEYHRVELMRIFKPESDIHTSFEVVPTHTEHIRETEEKMDKDINEARTIIREFRKSKTKEGSQ